MELEKALKLVPQRQYIYEKLSAISLQLHDYDAAVKYLTAGISKVEAGEVDRMKSLKARVLAVCQGKFSEASALLESSSSRSGYNIADTIFQASLAAKTGDIANTRFQLKMAQTECLARINWNSPNPNTPEFIQPSSLLDLAIVENALGRPDKAISHYTRALSAAEYLRSITEVEGYWTLAEEGLAYLQRAEIYEKQNQLEKAQVDYKKAIEKYSAWLESYNKDSGRRKGVERILALGYAHSGLATAYEKTGQAKLAKAEREKAKALGMNYKIDDGVEMLCE